MLSIVQRYEGPPAAFPRSQSPQLDFLIGLRATDTVPVAKPAYVHCSLPSKRPLGFRTVWISHRGSPITGFSHSDHPK